MAKWQQVYKTNIQHRAEIVKAVLEDAELSPILMDKTDSAYRIGSIGYYEVLVPSEHVMKALKIIQDEIVFE